MMTVRLTGTFARHLQHLDLPSPQHTLLDALLLASRHRGSFPHNPGGHALHTTDLPRLVRLVTRTHDIRAQMPTRVQRLQVFHIVRMVSVVIFTRSLHEQPTRRSSCRRRIVRRGRLHKSVERHDRNSHRLSEQNSAITNHGKEHASQNACDRKKQDTVSFSLRYHCTFGKVIQKNYHQKSWQRKHKVFT